MNQKTIVSINKVELQKEIDRQARKMARKMLAEFKLKYKVGQYYNGRELKVHINSLILNLQ